MLVWVELSDLILFISFWSIGLRKKLKINCLFTDIPWNSYTFTLPTQIHDTQKIYLKSCNYMPTLLDNYSGILDRLLQGDDDSPVSLCPTRSAGAAYPPCQGWPRPFSVATAGWIGTARRSCSCPERGPWWRTCEAGGRSWEACPMYRFCWKRK